MSGYRIVLNLTGNASRQLDKLANDLARANASAISLASSLGLVAAASRGVHPIDVRNSAHYTPKPPVIRQQIRRPRTQVEEQPHYTRHTGTRIGSFGVGGSFGMFSGRLSTILQPNAKGEILGMNARKLAVGANVAAIAGSLTVSATKFALKAVAATTLAPILIGGGGLMAAVNALQSESFAEGVRLISRKHQAKLGMGSDYLRGQASADFLAGSYGFDRSTALSSINVLSGMRVGGTDRKLNVSEATGLTKVGGLIAQQSGVSFERVMTNIQQLLVQATPNLRDIRELLGQAPILGKYAVKDMEAKGVKGVDTRTWLKDQGNLMSVLKRYELDLASNRGMQARGQIDVAQKAFWEKIAGNEAWTYVGRMGSDVIGSSATALNNLLTSLSKNDSFKMMVAHIETIFESLGTKGGTFVQKLTDLVDGLSQRYGLGVGDKGKARDKVAIWNGIEQLVAYTPFQNQVLAIADQRGIFKDYKDPIAKKQAQDNYLLGFEGELQQNKDYVESVKRENKFRRPTSLATSWMFGNGFTQNVATAIALNTGIKADNKAAALSSWTLNGGSMNSSIVGSIGAKNKTLLGSETFIGKIAPSLAIGNGANKNVSSDSYVVNPWSTSSTYRYMTPSTYKNLSTGQKTPTDEGGSYLFDLNKTLGLAAKYADKLIATGSNVPDIDTKNPPDDGKSLSGFNRDRRALEIHFNAPIVEWTSNIEATSPMETVQAVKDNIELIAATAIQKALLGASNKMSQTF